VRSWPRRAIPERLWNTPSIATPYKEQLSVEERIAGLSKFWAEARQYFVHFDNVPDLAWDRAYVETLSKVMAATTTADYYRVMMQFAARLEDGHTDVYPPRELLPSFYSRPRSAPRRSKSKVLVLDIPSPSLAKRVHPGDEVIAIDGVPVLEFARRSVMPMASGSTPQDRDVRTFFHINYSLVMRNGRSSSRSRPRTERDARRRSLAPAISTYAAASRSSSAFCRTASHTSRSITSKATRATRRSRRPCPRSASRRASFSTCGATAEDRRPSVC